MRIARTQGVNHGQCGIVRRSAAKNDFVIRIVEFKKTCEILLELRLQPANGLENRNRGKLLRRNSSAARDAPSADFRKRPRREQNQGQENGRGDRSDERQHEQLITYRRGNRDQANRHRIR